jgi:hypothetical protein
MEGGRKEGRKERREGGREAGAYLELGKKRSRVPLDGPVLSEAVRSMEEKGGGGGPGGGGGGKGGREGWRGALFSPRVKDCGLMGREGRYKGGHGGRRSREVRGQAGVQGCLLKIWL